MHGYVINRKIAKLYKALKKKKYQRFAELCHEFPEGPLQRISLHDDTILHIAARSKKKDLVLDLLKMLRPAHPPLSDIKDTEGNTILHEVAASDDMINVAEELLRRDPGLITLPNKLGERPIFCAARYGQIQMFKFLDEKMQLIITSLEGIKAHLRRTDGTTALHISIATESFGMAHRILTRYPDLVEERDGSSMTALQYLACNPTPFQKKKPPIKRGVIDLKLGTDDSFSKKKPPIRRGVIEKLNFETDDSFPLDYSIIGNMEDFLRNKFQDVTRYVCSKLLPKYFSKDETTLTLDPRLQRWWLECVVRRLITTNNSLNHNIDSLLAGLDEEGEDSYKHKKSNESALFMATKSNNKEIVKAILEFHPASLEQTNEEGMNILHMAILYRHIEIFDMVVEHEVLATRLLSATDKQGNSALHMVSQKGKSQASEKMQSPAFQLRDELRLFEKVKSACKMLVTNPLNKRNETAEELFAAANVELHREAKEWLMRTTENCTILSVFIATVAFAAAYTVPGGSDQNSGYPMFRSKPFFAVFVLADVMSITSALISVGIFLSILTSSFPLEDFKIYLFKKLINGIVCLVLSVSTMAVAFGATIVLMMSRNRESAIWSVVAFLPVPIFFLSYSPLRSPVLRPFKAYIVKFLIVVATVTVLFLLILPYEALRWTVKKASRFIHNVVPWMGGKISSTQSPHLTTPRTEV